MVIFFPVGGGFSLEGARAIEGRHGDIDRLDAWFARVDGGEISPGVVPPMGPWAVFDLRWEPDAESVMRAMMPGLPFGTMRPAEGDLDERGLCRCGCMSTVEAVERVARLMSVEIRGRVADDAPPAPLP